MKLPPSLDHGLPLFPCREVASLLVRVQDKYGAWAGLGAPRLVCTVSHTSRAGLCPYYSFPLCTLPL